MRRRLLRVSGVVEGEAGARQQPGARRCAPTARRSAARPARRRCRARPRNAASSGQHLAVQGAVEEGGREQGGAVEAARTAAVDLGVDAGGRWIASQPQSTSSPQRREPVAAADQLAQTPASMPRGPGCARLDRDGRGERRGRSGRAAASPGSPPRSGVVRAHGHGSSDPQRLRSTWRTHAQRTPNPAQHRGREARRRGPQGARDLRGPGGDQPDAAAADRDVDGVRPAVDDRHRPVGGGRIRSRTRGGALTGSGRVAGSEDLMLPDASGPPLRLPM